MKFKYVENKKIFDDRNFWETILKEKNIFLTETFCNLCNQNNHTKQNQNITKRVIKRVIKKSQQILKNIRERALPFASVSWLF